MENIFLGVGTNLGDREGNLIEALTMIKDFPCSLVASSSVYETDPWGFQTANQFLNMVLKIRSDLSPRGLIKEIFKIEENMGRVRSEIQYTSRIIDIDILLFGNLITDEKNLVIPHPKMHQRKFVLIPMCEIDGKILHPVFKMPMLSLLKSCKDKGEVKFYKRDLV